MATKTLDDARKAQPAGDIDCTTVEQMSLSELLYEVLTGEGSPFRIASSPEAA